jgi:adenylosuccinate lyase
LAADAILELLRNVGDGLVVYPKVIAAHLEAELPFMATETILMDAVKRGGNRQELHERIRVHSMAAAKAVKEDGAKNDLLERIAADLAFGLNPEELAKLCRPEKFTGRSAHQVTEYLSEVIKPLLEKYQNVRIADAEIQL